MPGGPLRRVWEPPASHPRSRNFMQPPHIVWSLGALPGSRSASKGSHVPVLFGILHIDFGERSY